MRLPQNLSASTYKILALLGLLIAMTVWALSSPIGSSPDDDYHLASSYCSHGNRPKLCVMADETQVFRVPALITRTYDCFLNGLNSSECLQFEGSNFETTTRINSNNAYPKTFYWVNGFFANPNVDVGALLMRILNIAVTVILLLLSYSKSSPLIKSVMPLALACALVPLGIFILPSNNPSSWSVTGIFVYWVGLSSSFQRRKMADNLISLSFALIGGAAAISSRSDSALLLMIVTVAIMFQISSRCSDLMTSNKNRLLGGLVVFLFLVDSALNRTNLVSQGFEDSQNGLALGHILFNNLQNYPRYFLAFFGFSFWGGTPMGHLAWFQIPVPILASLIILATAIFLGCRNIQKWPKSDKFSIVFLLFCIVSIPLVLHQRDETLIGESIQPRYLYSLFLIIMTLCIANSRRDTWVSEKMVLSITAGLTVAHSLVLLQFIGSYTRGFNSSNSLVFNESRWGFSPLSPELTWLVGSVAFSVFTFASVHLYSAPVAKNDVVVLNNKMW